MVVCLPIISRRCRLFPWTNHRTLEVVSNLSTDPDVTLHLPHPPASTPASRQAALAELCREWLYYEAAGTRLRMAHRCAEWDGWEEGLVESILGPEDFEGEWFRLIRAIVSSPGGGTESDHDGGSATASHCRGGVGGGGGGSGAGRHTKKSGSTEGKGGTGAGTGAVGVRGPVKLSSKLPILEEQENEQMLNTTGDICGGRGGELVRRLEAWLSVSGNVQQLQQQQQHHDLPPMDFGVESAR
ncbi:hypothetical protein BJ912DRAFT_1055445 [Pholiota molesta]|nr:hypothetical protein BJ912DRAFT_1055445 [Pholiota molesta]